MPKPGRPLRTSRASRARVASLRTRDARPDTLDVRASMFEPSLIEVPVPRTRQDCGKCAVPVLDQVRQ